MNQKLAKMLRKIARLEAAKNNLPEGDLIQVNGGGSVFHSPQSERGIYKALIAGDKMRKMVK
jgi:hypothetical protein